MIRKLGLCLLCIMVAVTGMTLPAGAAVRYMPDVTKEMSKASYWTDKVGDPQYVQTDLDRIKELNQKIYAKSSMTNDLRAYTEDKTFNGVAQIDSLVREADEVKDSGALWQDAKYDYDVGVRYYREPESGVWETLPWEWTPGDTTSPTAVNLIYRPMVENAIDPNAEEEMHYKFAICTTRTCMQAFPSPRELYDDPYDPDFSYKTHTVVRVGEPVVLSTCSADGAYYRAITASMRGGWIPAKDIAICESRDEWLAAWDTDDVLVVLDDKIYTEESNYAPQTGGRKLTMGTRLRLADASEIGGRINNRTAHNNHVVWMPVRRDDGTYTEQLALIGENRKVSEGYLPVTTENILQVAMNQLGDTYGWGGMLESEDCSGFMRTVYSCFGLDLPRNVDRTNGVLKAWNLAGMSDAEKTAFIRTLPPGTILVFPGHEMMYLGYEGDLLYVISSVSTVMLDGERTRVRGGVINTLNVTRANGHTWLQDLKTAEVPYLSSDDPDPQLSLVKASVTGIKNKTFTGKALTQKLSVGMGGITLAAGTDYKITYRKNTNAGTASFTIAGIGAYKGSIKKSFRIAKASNPMKASGKTVKVKRKTLKKKAVTIKATSAYKITSAKGTRTFVKVKGSKKLTVAKNGKITVKKKTKKGTYKVVVRVKAAGTANYKSVSKTVNVTVRVK